MDPAIKRLLVLSLAIIIGCEVAIRASGNSDPVADAVLEARHAEGEGDFVHGLALLRAATADHPDRALGWVELAERLTPMGTRAAAAEALTAYDHAAACHDDPELVRDAQRRDALVWALMDRLPEALPRLQLLAAGGDAQAKRVYALLVQFRPGDAADAALEDALAALPSDAALSDARAVHDAEAGAPAAAQAVVAGASPSENDADGWVRLEEARAAVAIGQEGRAATLLAMVPQVVDSLPLESVVPLGRADLAQERLFLRGPITRALVAAWPVHAPWGNLPLRAVVKTGH